MPCGKKSLESWYTRNQVYNNWLKDVVYAIGITDDQVRELGEAGALRENRAIKKAGPAATADKTTRVRNDHCFVGMRTQAWQV